MDGNKTKRDREPDREPDGEHDEPVRQGDILGLGGAAVPKSPADKRTSSDKSGTRDSTSDHDEEHSSETAYRRKPGATGIDMGAGGSGTDVE
jgi:hypothetical protein